MEDIRPFTFTLSALLEKHKKNPNYICFSVSLLAGEYFRDNPKKHKTGINLDEYPESSAVIEKFRELMPNFFVARGAVAAGTEQVITYHMKKEVLNKNFADPRLYLLEETIKVYGGDFELTMDISPMY